MDILDFNKACDKVINVEREKNGIGTLKEKPLHAILKHYFEPNEDNHEIRTGRYVADIYNESGIIEIQTGNFNKLRGKLSVFLEQKPVTLVYPIPYTKWIIWMDEEKKEMTKRRKSPKTGSPYMVFRELYKIKDYLLHPNFNLCIVMLNTEEFKILNGWSKDKKKGATKLEQIPIKLVEELYIHEKEEYKKLIPDSLGTTFLSKDYKRATHLSLPNAQTALNVLYYVGAVKRVGKVGNAYIYERNDDTLE